MTCSSFFLLASIFGFPLDSLGNYRQLLGIGSPFPLAFSADKKSNLPLLTLQFNALWRCVPMPNVYLEGLRQARSAKAGEKSYHKKALSELASTIEVLDRLIEEEMGRVDKNADRETTENTNGKPVVSRQTPTAESVEMAAGVIRENGKPMEFKVLWEKLLERGLDLGGSKRPRNLMYTRLRNNSLRKEGCLVVQIGRKWRTPEMKEASAPFRSECGGLNKNGGGVAQ